MYNEIKERVFNVNESKLSSLLFIDKDIDDFFGISNNRYLNLLPYSKYLYCTSLGNNDKVSYIFNAQLLEELAKQADLDIHFYTRYSSLKQPLDSDAVFGSVCLTTQLPTKDHDDVKIYSIKRK